MIASKLIRNLERFRIGSKLIFRKIKFFILGIIMPNNVNFTIPKIHLLHPRYADGLVFKITLRPQDDETERAVLILLCAGIKRHLHIKDAEYYNCVFNLSLSPVHSGWTGRGTNTPWHEIPKGFGLRIVSTIKKESAD